MDSFFDNGGIILFHGVIDDAKRFRETFLRGVEWIGVEPIVLEKREIEQ